MISSEEVGSVVRSRGCSARFAYWNVNYFGVIRAIAVVVQYRLHAGRRRSMAVAPLMATAGEERILVPASEREIKCRTLKGVLLLLNSC